ncbi:MAG: hypothetical protein PHZ04_05300 [Patescibacteria group bacterium]|nr:hypothetical protein [Patescibacteria group bacterium]
MENLFDRKTGRIILIIFLAELFSIFAFWLPNFEKAAFFIIITLVLILSLVKLEYGILILLTELFIGSKGYLFYLDIGGAIISIRIALWLIVMAVWLGKIINKTIHKEPSSEASELSSFRYFIPLFIFIVWGLINGFLNHNGFSNIFFDFNGWLYFVLIFPIYDFINPVRNNFLSGANGARENIYDLGRVFLAAAAWLSFKTFFFLFTFSHDCPGIILELYQWVRTTGVGEITPVEGGFYRIFFQSHIFILIGFFLLLAFLLYQPPKNKKFFVFSFSFLVLALSVILVSFSRSFWLGLGVGLLFYYLILIFRKEGRNIVRLSGVLLGAALAAIILTLVIV